MHRQYFSRAFRDDLAVNENPYQSPAIDDTPPPRTPHRFALSMAGLLFVLGIALAVGKAIVQTDWLLGIAILLMVIGLSISTWIALRPE